MLRAVTLAAGVLLAGPVLAQPAPQLAAAAAPAPAVAEIADPWENTNRRLFAVHKGLDRTVVGPVARGYKAVTPQPVRRGVRNVLNNLGEPVTFVNDVLQGQFGRAGKTATRFVANSTVGVLGVFDVAGAAGLPIHYEDFGQTMAVYGAKPGPYLFIPLLGPTSVRDAGGRVVDSVAHPVGQLESGAAIVGYGNGVNAVDSRATYDPEVRRLEQSATDEYATYRSLYAQNRRAEIANGQTDVADLPEFEAPPPDPRPATPRRRRR